MQRKNVLISPSILDSDLSDIGGTLRRLDLAGVDRIHLDVMDGHFVRNLSLGPRSIQSARRHAKAPFETHLMISNPEKYVKEFADAGSDIIIVHSEASHKLESTIRSIRGCGAMAGIALKPGTRVEAARKYLGRIDTLLIMGVHPGFGGQRFISRSLVKIKKARDMIDELGLKTVVAVDGGMNADTARLAIAAGADEIVAGSAIFKSNNPVGSIARLRKIADHELQVRNLSFRYRRVL